MSWLVSCSKMDPVISRILTISLVKYAKRSTSWFSRKDPHRLGSWASLKSAKRYQDDSQSRGHTAISECVETIDELADAAAGGPEGS